MNAPCSQPNRIIQPAASQTLRRAFRLSPEAWRALLFADEDQRAKEHRDPVAPARRSAKAQRKALTHTLDNGAPVHSLRALFEELSTIVRNTCRTPASAPDSPTFTIVTRPNRTQQRALELLDTIRV